MIASVAVRRWRWFSNSIRSRYHYPHLEISALTLAHNRYYSSRASLLTATAPTRADAVIEYSASYRLLVDFVAKVAVVVADFCNKIGQQRTLRFDLH
jgi:hypothetical protein